MAEIEGAMIGIGGGRESVRGAVRHTFNEIVNFLAAGRSPAGPDRD
jgi:hypothetical protein